VNQASARAPSKRPLLIACDQAGVVRPNHYGFGTLWLPYDRRGDLSGSFRQMQAEAEFSDVLRWERIGRGGGSRFARALVDYFFRTPWLAFHCLVVERNIVDMSKHGNDLDLAQRKHFTMLLANKIKTVTEKRGPHQEFRVWASPLPSRYQKAHEAVEIISSNIVARTSGHKPALRVTLHSPAEAPSLQLCGTLLGAVVEEWNQGRFNQQKKDLIQRIAHGIGWEHLRHDTPPGARKFNIWKFYDPVREASRSAKTRSTQTK